MKRYDHGDTTNSQRLRHEYGVDMVKTKKLYTFITVSI